MPTFVIHTLGKASQKVTFATSPVRIGRETTNDIVLPDETVSREHAVVIQISDGRWQVSCVSETNPIVVDGRLTTQGIGVSEGSEMLVGGQHMLVFSENEFKADNYISVKPTFEKNRCSRCDWSGMISTLKRNTACPKCGCADLVPVDRYSGTPDAPKARKSQPATTALDGDAARAMFSKLKAAKSSHIERIDEHATAAPRTELTEDKSISLRTSTNPDLRLHGFMFGDVTIAWNGGHFEIVSTMIFPALKINGAKEKKAKLKSGDQIEIGSNRFKFVTG